MPKEDLSVSVTVPGLVHPAGKKYWLEDSMFPLDDDGMYTPRFSVQEASKAFFGEGADWLRWRMRPDRPSTRNCSTCKGKGVFEGKRCKPCKGVGKITEPSKHPEGFFVLDGKPLEFKRLKVSKDSKKRDDPNAVTARYYTLADIERMAHALAQQGIINGVRLSNIVIMVRACAWLYGVDGTSPVDTSEPAETDE